MLPQRRDARPQIPAFAKTTGQWYASFSPGCFCAKRMVCEDRRLIADTIRMDASFISWRLTGWGFVFGGATPHSGGLPSWCTATPGRLQATAYLCISYLQVVLSASHFFSSKVTWKVCGIQFRRRSESNYLGPVIMSENGRVMEESCQQTPT